MSDLKQYVQDAIRTESRIESIRTNRYALTGLLKLHIATGNLLDMVKKNVFYNKPIDSDAWDKHLNVVKSLPTNQDISSVSQEQQYVQSDINIDPRLFHAIIGIATESTELLEAILKALDNGTDIDHVNVQEELGDLNWYQAIAVDASDADWDKILETNITKLKHRYPDKFTSENAINRDLDTERKILEKGIFMQGPIETHPGRVYRLPE